MQTPPQPRFGGLQTHVPSTQLSPAAQAVPPVHPEATPQYWVLVLGLTHWPAQRIVPLAHVQIPSEQLAPGGHAVPPVQSAPAPQ